MQDALRVLASRVDRAVNVEAGRIDIVWTVLDLPPIEVDLDQTGRRDLFEEFSIGIDEEVVFRPGDADRDVREDQVVPTVQRDQAITGGQIDARLPLRLVCHGPTGITEVPCSPSDTIA